MSLISETFEIARVDLIVERRAGETVRVILPFAVAALAVFPLALGFRLELIGSIGLTVYWALGVLFGMQVALRQSAEDSRERRDHQALMGLDPAARFLGRALSATLLLSVFMAVLFTAMFLLYSPDVSGRTIAMVVVATALLVIGLSELATLAGEVAGGLRHRSALASLLVVPMALPLVIGASQSVEAIERDTGILPWLLLLIATDLALGLVGIGLAKPIEEAST